MQLLPDRTSYSLKDMPVASGGTATEALRTVPELEVDVDGKVTARGATPRIYINGRPAPMQGEALDNYLQQLPADRIDRIEVIPNPSAARGVVGGGTEELGQLGQRQRVEQAPARVDRRGAGAPAGAHSQ